MSDYMQGNSGAQLFSSIFAASSSSTVESGATTAAGLSAANPGKTSFHTFMAGGNITATGAQGSATNAAPPSTELAHFCKNNNINSNVVVVPSPQRATAIFGGSAMSQQMQHQQSPLLPSGVALNIPQHVRSGLDERLQSPYRAQQQVLVDNAVDDDKVGSGGKPCSAGRPNIHARSHYTHSVQTSSCSHANHDRQHFPAQKHLEKEYV